MFLWLPAKSGPETSITFRQVDGKTGRRKSWENFAGSGCVRGRVDISGAYQYNAGRPQGRFKIAEVEGGHGEDPSKRQVVGKDPALSRPHRPGRRGLHPHTPPSSIQGGGGSPLSIPHPLQGDGGRKTGDGGSPRGEAARPPGGALPRNSGAFAGEERRRSGACSDDDEVRGEPGSPNGRSRDRRIRRMPLRARAGAIHGLQIRGRPRNRGAVTASRRQVTAHLSP